MALYQSLVVVLWLQSLALAVSSRCLDNVSFLYLIVAFGRGLVAAVFGRKMVLGLGLVILVFGSITTRYLIVIVSGHYFTDV